MLSLPQVLFDHIRHGDRSHPDHIRHGDRSYPDHIRHGDDRSHPDHIRHGRSVTSRLYSTWRSVTSRPYPTWCSITLGFCGVRSHTKSVRLDVLKHLCPTLRFVTLTLCSTLRSVASTLCPMWRSTTSTLSYVVFYHIHTVLCGFLSHPDYITSSP